MAGITLDAGADENGPPSKILPVTRRDERERGENRAQAKKITGANSHVALVSALPAPLAPNTVWLDPPNAGADLRAPVLLAAEIMMTIATQTIT